MEENKQKTFKEILEESTKAPKPDYIIYISLENQKKFNEAIVSLFNRLNVAKTTPTNE